MSKKQKFPIYITWKMEAIVEIEAETEEEAVRKANDIDLPEGAIVEDSFEASAKLDED